MPWRQVVGGTQPGTIGSVPEKCDLCGRVLSKYRPGTAYDGRTNLGPWAWMCWECFDLYGTGLGIGRGQQYCWCEDEPAKTDLDKAQALIELLGI